MPSWVLKAMVQGTIAPLPGAERINHLLQRHLTGSVLLSEEGFEGKLQQCARHLHNHRACRNGTAPASVLELGTGWSPVIPVGLALAGAERVITIDVNPLLDAALTRRVLELYASRLQRCGLTAPGGWPAAFGEGPAALVGGPAPAGRPAPGDWPAAFGPGLRPDRVQALIAAAHGRGREVRDPRDLLGPLGVEARVGDARSSGLAAGSIDLFVSNNTLEHIPPQMLGQIMSELRRLAAPGAVMDHFVDMSDHYAHFDGGITEFNYMRYSDRRWRVFNNRLQYQNRLRASDYRRIIEQAGFDLVSEQSERGSLDDLRRVKLAPRFRTYAEDDLLVLRSWFTAVARD